MPLDTEVKGDPASLRASAQWLRELATAAHDAGTAARGAVGTSETSWMGPAADTFRDTVGRSVGEVDEIAAANERAATALTAHADDLDTVKARMAQARTVASAAGITVTGNLICDPPPGDDAKRKAYEECVRTVADAGTHEKQSQSTVAAFFGNLHDVASPVLKGLDITTSAAGGYINQREFKLSTFAASCRDAANTTLGQAYDKFGGGYPAEAVAADMRVYRRFTRMAARAERDLNAMLGPMYGPPTTRAQAFRNFLVSPIGNIRLTDGKVATLFKSVPKMSVALTAVGIGLDIAANPTWKTAATSTAAGVGGTLAATWVAGLFPPTAFFVWPVGAGLVVGWSADWAIRNYGDDAVDAAKDAAENVKDGAKEAWDKGKGALDKAKSVFGL